MLDLGSEFALYGDAVRAAIEGVLETQRFVGGPAVEAFEVAMCEHVGVAHAVAVSSGTDALLCTLMALGVGAGDEVILPTFTFFATAGSVVRIGAKPVFVDVDPRTFNIDPDAVEQALTDRTRAIIAVHLFGQCAEMDAINEIAKRRGVLVIEDAAQAIGATYHARQAGSTGRSAGTLGDAACLSFYPTKNLGGCGEGGMILTGSDELAVVARQLRNHGQTGPYDHAMVGGNFRLDSLQAAVLSVKLNHLDDFTKRRRRNAARYAELLSEVPVTRPLIAEGHEPVYHQYTILCQRRDALRAFLQDRGVGTGLFYPIPLHRQKCFASLDCRTGKPVSLVGACPVAERLCEQVVSLPCHPMLSEEDVEYVSSCVREFYSETRAGDTATTAAAKGRTG